jgi:NAD(P)-dependent dehydrogenase (short-subunit alcohol dehydrogenase family)
MTEGLVPPPTSSAGRLAGRRALITGGGSGIGRAIVDRFLAEGCAVGVLEISEERLEHLEAAHPGRLVLVRGDATRLGDNQWAVDAVVERFGGLDCFVANTGVWDFGVSAEDLPTDDRFDDAFRQLFDLNVKAMLAGAKAAAAALRTSRGALVMTASNASLHPGGGGPLYTAAKHAVVGLVKQLAYELAPDVRVNAVAPGGMRTALAPPPALAHLASSIADLPMDELISLVSPLEFLPQPADYVGWYVALASASDALTMTGSVIECDGGEGVRGRAWSERARALANDPRATEA